MPVPFYRHSLDPTLVANQVAEVAGNPIITSGAVGDSVAKAMELDLGYQNVLLTNSWTNGAVAVLLAAGIGPGDEVIVPAMTFAATANVVRLVGATPVFVDVRPDTLLIDLRSVERQIGPATKAIIPVHLYGQTVDLSDLIYSLRGRKDILLIEDCAHSYESICMRDNSQSTSVAIFSFYATKNLTCGEGGAIATNDDSLMAQIRQTALHGMTAGAAKRFEGGRYRGWDQSRLGTKANLPDLLAALLVGQVGHWEQPLSARQAIAARYRSACRISNLRVPAREGTPHSEHLFPIWVPPQSRDAVMDLLASSQIGCTLNYQSVPTLTHYRNQFPEAATSTPVSNDWGEGTLSLPLFPTMSDHEVGEVESAIQAIGELLGSTK